MQTINPCKECKNDAEAIPYLFSEINKWQVCCTCRECIWWFHGALGKTKSEAIRLWNLKNKEK